MLILYPYIVCILKQKEDTIKNYTLRAESAETQGITEICCLTGLFVKSDI